MIAEGQTDSTKEIAESYKVPPQIEASSCINRRKSGAACEISLYCTPEAWTLTLAADLPRSLGPSVCNGGRVVCLAARKHLRNRERTGDHCQVNTEYGVTHAHILPWLLENDCSPDRCWCNKNTSAKRDGSEVLEI